MPSKKHYTSHDLNSNKITGLPTPTDNSDAATKAYVDSRPTGSVNTVNSISPVAGNVLISATNIAITDANNNFTTDTVQGAIDELFTSANNGKTSIASAIGSPAVATNTFAQLASAITTGKGQIATATGNASVNSSSTFQQLADAVGALSNPTYGIERTVTYDETIAKGDVVESYYKSMSLTRLTQPSVLPEGNANGVAWSVDGKLFAVAHATTPFLSIFNYDEATNTFTNFADPSTGTGSFTTPIMPPSTANGIDFSSNGDFLAVAHSSTNQFSLYRRNASTFTKLPNIIAPGGSNGFCVAFSPNNNYLSAGASGGFGVYFRSGESFTKLNDSETYGALRGTAWSQDSNYTIACYTTAPFFKIMRRNGDGTTASLTRVASSEALDGTAQSAAWSYDGQYLAIAYTGTSATFGANKIAIYKQSGDTFTRLSVTNSPTITAGATGVCWSKDGRYVYLTVGTSPSFCVIKRTGDTFTFLTNPTTPFGTVVNSVAVHPNNNIVSVGHDVNNFLTHYRNDGVYLYTKANTDVINPIDKIIGIAKESGNAGQQRKVDVLVGRSLLP